jgi:TPR repeat protein
MNMSIKIKFTGFVLSLLLSSGTVLASAGDFNKGLKAFTAGDFKTVLAEWVPLAEMGHVIAQNNLGVMYSNGNGVLENDKAAVEWLTLAAEQGYADSQHNLGAMYDNGEGVPENDKTAVKWYTLAAEQGYADSQFLLGFKYEYGSGIAKDYKAAVKWYTKAAKQGNAEAQFYLGRAYEFGDGVLMNKWRAYMWYNLSTSIGYVLALNAKDYLATQITPADISKAQDMSSRCLESNYTDC